MKNKIKLQIVYWDNIKKVKMMNSVDSDDQYEPSDDLDLHCL